MNKDRQQLTQIIRHTVQLAAFLGAPGAFILIFSSFGSVIRALATGTFTLAVQLPSLIVILAAVPVTILLGRIFCGYLCAFGSMQELVSRVAAKLRIRQIKPGPKADRVLKKVKYIILVISILAWAAGISFYNASPWNVFGRLTSLSSWSVLFTLGGALLVMIIAVSLFIERAFCRYLCPLGAIFSLISRGRLFRIKKDRLGCVGCGKCSSVCPMAIDVNCESEARGYVSSGECINCFKCKKACPVAAVKTTTPAAVTGTAAAIMIAGICSLSGIIQLPARTENAVQTSSNTPIYIAETDDSIQIPEDTANSNTGTTVSGFADGVYQGTGTGYRGSINVTVTVSGGNITAITVDSYRDDAQFFNRAKSTVINEILQTQSVEVDAVSGATYSSRGIMSAVADALDLEFTPSYAPAQSSRSRK